MKQRFLTFFGMAIALGALMAVSTQTAKADIVTYLSGITAAAGGGYDFNYTVELSATEELLPAATAGFAEFGTLYDIDSSQMLQVSNITGDLASMFTFTEQLTNTPAYNTTPTDSSSLYNVRYTYNGTSTLNGSGSAYLMLGTFSLVSPSDSVRNTFYDGEAANYYAPVGGETGNLGSTQVPAGAPEPASLLLMGSGLLGLSFLGRRGLRKNSKD